MVHIILINFISYPVTSDTTSSQLVHNHKDLEKFTKPTSICVLPYPFPNLASHIFLTNTTKQWRHCAEGFMKSVERPMHLYWLLNRYPSPLWSGPFRSSLQKGHSNASKLCQHSPVVTHALTTINPMAHRTTNQKQMNFDPVSRPILQTSP